MSPLTLPEFTTCQLAGAAPSLGQVCKGLSSKESAICIAHMLMLSPEALHVIGWRECAAFANTNKGDGQTLRPLPFLKGILGCRDSPTPVLTAIELLLSSFRLLSLSSSWAPQSSEVTEIIDPRKDNEILGKDFRALPKLQCFQLLEPKRQHRENGCLPV